MATTLVVNAGETSSGITFSPTGTYSSATVYGTLENSIIDVNDAALIVQVSSGGVARGISINGALKGQLIARRYGTTYDTVVNTDAGYEMVEGVASGTIVSKGYQWVRQSYSESYDTIIRGGSQTVYGTAYDTTVSGGSQIIYNGGTASRTVYLGGSGIVSSGGVMRDTVISGGRFSVLAGATIDNITVMVGNGQNAVIRPEANGTIFTGNVTMDFSTAVAATTTANYFLSSVARVAANPDVTYTIKVAQEGQYSGEYCMGGGSTNITATVVTDTGLTLGSVSGGGSVNGAYLHTQFGSYRLYTSTYQYVGIVADPVAVFQGTTIVARGTTVDTAITVDSAKEAYVRKGGTLKNLTVDAAADGKVAVYSGGVLDTATVTGSVAGNIAVSNGGVANHVTLAGASAYLRLSGGTANDAVVSAGTLYLLTAAAEAYRTTASAGLVDISAGRTESTTLYGAAREMVRNGATATSTIIEIGATGNQFVRAGGIAYNTIVSGGSQQLYDINAKAYDTVVSGGAQQVYAGASAVRTILRGGNQTTVSGTVGAVIVDTVISGGTQSIVAGATASNTTIVAGNGARMRLEADAALTAGYLNWDLSEMTAAPEASYNMLNAWRVTAGTDLYVTVKANAADQATGNYYLSSGASSFNSTITIKDTDGTILGTIGKGENLVTGLYDFTLTVGTVIGNGLVLTVDVSDHFPVEIYTGAELTASGTTIENATLNSGMSAYVRNGGTLSSATINNAGANNILVSAGGLLKDATLTGTGVQTDVRVYTGGVAQGTIIDTAATGGAIAIQRLSGGTGIDTVIQGAQGQELVYAGAVASNTVVKTTGAAQKLLAAGAVASGTVVSAGFQQLVAGASAWNTTIIAGSNGYVSLAEGAITGGTWNFDLTQGVQMDTAMLNAWRITSGTDLVITVDVDNMPTGKCYFSSGASYFGDTTFTVKDTDGNVLASDFGDGDKFVIDDVVYKLALEGSGLYFSVITDPVEIYHGSEVVEAGAVITGAKIVDGWSATVNDTGLLAIPTIIKATQGKVLVSAGGEVAGATVAGFGTGTDIRVYGGGSAVDTYLADAAAYLRLSGGTGYDTTVVGGQLLMYAGAYASGATLYDGATQKLMNPGASAAKTVISNGGWMQVGANLAQSSYAKGGTAEDISVHSGGAVRVYSSATATGVKLLEENALGYVYSGGQIAFDSVASGARINVRFSEATGNEAALITAWGTVAAGAELGVKEVGGAGTFKIADSIDANITAVDYDEFDVFGGRVVNVGQNFSDVFEGLNYITTAADGTLTATALTVGSQTVAATLSDSTATTLPDGMLATTWTSTTDLSTVPVVANAATGADAWLTLDGTTVNGALYGAEGNFANDVNLKFRDGSITNLAAGAKAGGSVANVNVMVGDINPDWTEVSHGTTFNGVAYAGGFGNVTGTAGTVVNDGTFKKDFYAGALANKLDAATSVGEVNMTVNGGTFSGNIYGASAVKTVAGKNGLRHSVGDVTLTLAGGATTKGNQACVFAGGYATGDATGTVYTVGSVTLDVNSGDWGTAAGGRGIFGGIMASGVTAQAGDVDITISVGNGKTAPTMGNVYGGGWAQKNGTSIVGDVNITIEGGEIANVFGGGSHSSSTGSEDSTTEAGDVTITVKGGTITGAIYARGQADGDSVESAAVVFKGASAFDCGVFGYSYVGGAASDATLSFSGYTGTFSGAIAGFNSVTFDGITAMTLGTAKDKIDNTAWTFDVADRRAAFADTAMLNWTAADFTGDTITLNLATGDTNEWSLVTAATDTVYNKFDVLVNGSSIAAQLDIDDTISGGAYDGWGFTNDDGTLKFKLLA